jgi:hypothetical protein
VPTGPGAPAATGNTAADGRAWINYRRGQNGLSNLSQAVHIDQAAQSHSDYQRINNTVTHNEEPGKQGFTGATLLDRLHASGYTFQPSTGYAYGEVISATSSTSGFYLTEELITAIYHRFVIFEPRFKEVGTGAATNGSGYSYFTADFAANNGYGPGLGTAAVATWPFDGQAGVPGNFLSDYESPDPVPGANEVGYPISVHADIDTVLTVTAFSVHPHGGADLAVRQLTHGADPETPVSAAAIIPLAPLHAGTTYDVSFSGKLALSGSPNSVPISKSWSFTTK